MIRLLQAGHFKGVADVRLRINFNDELTAIGDGKTAEAVGQAVPNFLEMLTTQFDDFFASNDLPEDQTGAVTEAQGVFTAAVQGLLDGFSEG